MKFGYCLFFLCAVGASEAFAASQNITNSSTVVSACTINTVDHINLGAIDTLNFVTAEDTGTVRIVCSQGTFSVMVDNGRNPRQTNLSSVADGQQYTKRYTCQRRMLSASGNSTVAYNIYQANNVAVGNNKTITSTGSAFDSSYCANASAAFTSMTFSTATGSTQNLVMIGRAFPTTSTGATPGVYTDTLMYTINF